ncbi:hypothetical protein [Pseudoduganella flava]|uniref:Meckel syndrome type 1 protein n=1 Tax=Pseudoduganella flava TaxID=871742 RepID=A0ABX6FKB1_9BURK|nr:hypothetical protein [Pseudoduganella flava]QGZ37695.1 hypothetical protein GO485_00555 [Pseudoduganella flava]
MRYPPAMQPDSDSPDIPQPDNPAAAAPRASNRALNRIAWAGALVATVLVGAAAVWGVRTFQAESAIAGVERSAASLPLPKVLPRTAQGAQPTPGTPATPATPSMPPTPEATAAAPTGDRLPPLQLPGQRVAPAVLRDLPEWVAAQVGPAAPASPPASPPTSGASGDESAAVTEPRREVAKSAAREEAPRQRQPAQRSKSSAVFARCPGPGESGAVECRRAICAGAARKSSACMPYRD